MRRVNQYSEQVRDMHIVMIERHTRTSCVLLCSKTGKECIFAHFSSPQPFSKRKYKYSSTRIAHFVVRPFQTIAS